MSNINENKEVSTKLVTQKQIDMAQRKYDTEAFEEDVWEQTYDDTNEYINDCEYQIKNMEYQIKGLESKKTRLDVDLKLVGIQEKQLETRHDEISQKPEALWSDEERAFMRRYDRLKADIEFEKKGLNFSLEEMDNIIKRREDDIKVKENKENLLISHRDIRVKPKVEKEALDASKAFEELEELKELAELQGGAVDF